MSRKARYLLGVVVLVVLSVWVIYGVKTAPLGGLVVCTTLAATVAYLVGRRGARRRRADTEASVACANTGRPGIGTPGIREGERTIIDQFHRLYYDSVVFSNTSWLGVTALKCPLDMWIYQEIIHEVRPDVIVECGTAHGGSALFLASMCELLGKGQVVTMDVEEKPGQPQHPRIRYLLGSSTSGEIVEQVRDAVRDQDRVMVILDSDHSKDHVLAELGIYSELVTPGSYLIVEDTNLGHPVRPDFGPGPMEAVEEFLAARTDFAADRSREKFFLTFNPGGYLRRSQ